MRPTVPIACLAIALMTSACVSIGPAARVDGAPSGPLTVVRQPGLPAPPQARFYADCIAASATARTYDREAKADLVRFTCAGAPARAFYDGLAVYGAGLGSQVVGQGRTYRFTQVIEHDPFGLDDCSTDGEGDYRCVVVLNVGAFLSAVETQAP